MSAPIWPLSLPQKPDWTGYYEEIPLGLVSNEMDTGSKTRLDGVIHPTVFPCTYILDDEQWQTLKEFIFKTLVRGSRSFDLPHPENGKEYIRVKLESSQTLKKSRYKTTLKWQVTLQMEYIDYANYT